ncbi:MAG: hypothetical protein M5T61_20825 [Acidimicrobiia bacterium]|nr:hypothetical protein [Acidimicrobiia bacterium]
MVRGTHGPTTRRRPRCPSSVGNVSVTADQDTVVFLTSDAVWLATHGYADDITLADHPPAGRSSPTSSPTAAASGACGAAPAAGLRSDDLVDSAAIVTAASLAEALVAGATVMAF